jgi:uncharacterized membrane protein YraQ (UPF0718 family)
MEDFFPTLLEALKTTGLLIWYTLWAFIIGYLVSAGIQTLVTREQMANVLGDKGVKQAGLATFFGFVSSSCSFADLAATRSVLSKGAHAMNAMIFMVASTDLVIETGIVLWLLAGWRFVLAAYAVGIVMIILIYILYDIFFSKKIAEQGRKNAQKIEAENLKHPTPEGMKWYQKLTSKEGWKIISYKFYGEWKMALKEVLIGFTIAGLVSAFVPTSFWNTIFIGTGADNGADNLSFLAIVEHAAVAPFVALFTFVGSLGNIPLAVILWTKNASFAGVMSFLGADLVAGTVIYLNYKYYGWKFTARMTLLVYICMVAAGIIVYYIFALFNAIPTARPESLQDMMSFGTQSYTFYLNVIFGVVGIALLIIRWRFLQADKKQENA